VWPARLREEAFALIEADSFDVDTQSVTLLVPTMNCPVCPITVKKALIKVAGVSTADVNFEKRQATVTFDDAKTSIEALTRATRDAGYPSTMVGQSR
jgi:mercuric ion binding protein